MSDYCQHCGRLHSADECPGCGSPRFTEAEPFLLPDLHPFEWSEALPEGPAIRGGKVIEPKGVVVYAQTVKPRG